MAPHTALRWAIGERLSIADIHLFWRFRRSADVAVGAFPGLVAHQGLMMARPAVARTIEVEAGIGYELPA